MGPEDQSIYESKLSYPWMANKKVVDFLEDREISPDDYRYIDNLFRYPNQDFILLLHNHFNPKHEDSLADLEENISFYEKKLLTTAADNKPTIERSLALLRDFREFAAKYDWAVCYNLERILEEKRNF